MKMLKYGVVALTLVLAASNLAAAQSKKGPNGGTIVTSQGHPIEFVVKGQDIVFYIGDDDGSPLPTKGFQGRATVQDGGKTTTVALEASAPNLMTGTLAAPLGSKARVVFSGSFRAGSHTHTLTTRYVTE
jgi:hypothetical protein